MAYSLLQVLDMGAVVHVLSDLETFPITREALEVRT